jgi:hypothetical protein
MPSGGIVAPSVKVTLLLADSAQAVDGKLYILGGGWSIIGPEPTPTAIAIKLEVPWDQANRKHAWRLELIDQDGEPVTAPGPDGEPRPVEITGEFELGRPAGLKPGTPLDLPLAINLGPLPLPPGGRFVWRLSIDGESDEDWQVAFSTRPA